jgi:hypothetical protein
LNDYIEKTIEDLDLKLFDLQDDIAAIKRVIRMLRGDKQKIAPKIGFEPSLGKQKTERRLKSRRGARKPFSHYKGVYENTGNKKRPFRAALSWLRS